MFSGLLLFILYTKPFSPMITKFEDVQHHLYADDTQIFTSYNSFTYSTKIKSLQECLTSIQGWMFTNKLKLNADKTEFMLLGNKHHYNKFKIHSFQLISSITQYSLQLKLRIFQHHIKNTVKMCSYFIHDIGRVQKHLN